MNNTTLIDTVRTSPAQNVPPIPKDCAISFVAAYGAIRKIVGQYPAPKRPNRNRPTNAIDAQIIAAINLAQRTPALDDLQALAGENPPPAEFFDGDVERPW